MKPNNRAVHVGIMTLLCCLLLSAATWHWQEHRNAVEAAEKFRELSERVVSQINDRMMNYEYGVGAARGAEAAMDGHISRYAFKRYSATWNIEREFPGARGFGLIWRVAHTDEAAFTSAARADTWPDFSIYQLEPHSGDRYVIQYVEPIERNRQAVGLDIASERHRRAAALAAARSGEATLTEPITIVDATDKPGGSFLLLLPIYRPGAVITSPAEREAAVIGWSYATLVIDDVLRNIGNEVEHYTIALRDTLTSDSSTFYRSSTNDTPPAGAVRRQVLFKVLGRTWEVDLQATPVFVRGLSQTPPSQTMAITATIAALCSVLVTLLAQFTANKQNEQNKLIELSAQVRRAAIIDSSDDAILGILLDGTITDWNASAERLFGYAARDAVGRNVVDLLVPSSLTTEEAHLGVMAHRGERMPPFETKRRHRSGELIDVSISAAPIVDAAGRCIGYSKSLRDIRESQHIQSVLKAALGDTEALLRTLHQHAIVSVADRRGRITDVNDAFCAISGYSREELLGQDHRLLNSRHHEHSFWVDMWRTIANGHPWRGEICNRAKDGTEYWVNSLIAPFVGIDGRVEKYISIRNDITPIKQMALELQRTNDRFSLAADSARIGVWEYNLVTNALTWDKRMFVLYGHQEQGSDEPYSLWSKSLHPDDLVTAEAALQAAIAGTEEFDTEFRIVQPSGAVRIIKANATVERDTSGHAAAIYGVNYDITDARGAERRQAALVEKLISVNEELNSFAYIASHDLKSPLRGIEQLASWITEDLGDTLSEGTQEHLRLMRSRIKRMEMLLDDLLAYSRVGRSTDGMINISTRELVANIFELQASTKPIQLVLADEMPIVYGQKVPLELVFRNLISNAIKHHDKPQGSIWIAGRNVSGGFEFTVQDDGPGIPPQHQQRVFAMFQTLKPRDEVEGSGIGLALVKKAVESAGGRVTLESDGLKGCTFRFTWGNNNLEKMR
jgi:PAS domain S-box-containing protein